MATAITQPTTHAHKMKRPPPPFVQTGVNGVKQSQATSPPQPSAKRIPGAGQSTSVGSAGGLGFASAASSTNGVMVKGPLGKARKDVQRSGEQSPRLRRQSTRTALGDNGNRVAKNSPEPYVKTTSYILKKFSKCPPSLIIHLYPTHFRFEQQDGSFAYNSEMRIIIEHLRAGTVPHDMIEELLRAGIRFYEGCLIVRVVDHKSASAQARKSSESSSDDKNTPFSVHNYNEHITPSPFVPYPKHNLLTENSNLKRESGPSNKPETDSKGEQPGESEAADSRKPSVPKPRTFTTVLHPTPRSVHAELTLLATTPDPKALNRKQQTQSRMPTSSVAQPQSPADTTDRGHVAKRPKMMVEPQDLQECESKLTRALAPPLFLEPVGSLEAVHGLLKFLESPLHRDRPPSPKRRKRTVAELAADEALAAEEERFMLIMDERLEPTASGVSSNPKSAGVDDAGVGATFEPRFARFKTLENIRMQHAEKAKREHELKMKQEFAKRQTQEQERERRRALEQRQAEEHAKDERRQQIAAQQHLAAQQHRHAVSQANGASHRQQSSPLVRNQTPQATSSPLVSGPMASQGGVPMTLSASAGSPQRPASSLQHAHPGIMGHPMVASRSQQSRHGTPQMTHGTPAMSHATPIMRNVTPSQRMSHGSPTHSVMAPTPVMNHAMIGTPQMGNGMSLTPQQQQFLLHQRQLLAQQNGLAPHGQFTPQQIAHMQANAQMLHAQQQGIPHPQMHKFSNPQQFQLMRAQMQMQIAQQQRQQQQQQQQQNQIPGQQNQLHQGNPQLSPQQMQHQQQMLLAAAQANGGRLPHANPLSQRYTQLYHQQLLRLRQAMAQQCMAQYGPPTQYPPSLTEQYGFGLEKDAKIWVQKLMHREAAQHQQRALQAHALQQQQQSIMQNGMNK